MSIFYLCREHHEPIRTVFRNMQSPLLSKAEEKQLLDLYFNEKQPKRVRDKAKSDLLASHRRFAFNRAKILSNGDPEQFEEIYNAGCEGLVVGLDKFDNTSGMRFLTYAGWWVYQRQMKAMSEFRLVSLPTQKQQLSVRIKKFKDELGREPTMRELIIEFPDSSVNDLKELSRTSFLTFYFDNVNESDIPTLEGISTVEYEMLIGSMYKIIESFGPKDSDLIMRLYGLTDSGKRESYSQIQSDYPDVSRQYLKDLKEKALYVLQEEMNG